MAKGNRVRVYLKYDQAALIPTRTGTPELCVKTEKGGITITFEEGQAYIELDDTTCRIPDEIAKKGIITGISYHGSFSNDARRETGIYTHESAPTATARVENGFHNGMPGRTIRMQAGTMEDMDALYVMVRAGGNFRPTVSFEAPQGGKSSQELAAELLQVHTTLAKTEESLDNLKDHLKKFRRTLRSLRWPWSCNSSVAAVIDLWIGKEATTKSS